MNRCTISLETIKVVDTVISVEAVVLLSFWRLLNIVLLFHPAFFFVFCNFIAPGRIFPLESPACFPRGKLVATLVPSILVSSLGGHHGGAPRTQKRRSPLLRITSFQWFSFKERVGQNTASHALPTARTTVSLLSALPIHSASF